MNETLIKICQELLTISLSNKDTKDIKDIMRLKVKRRQVPPIDELISGDQGGGFRSRSHGTDSDQTSLSDFTYVDVDDIKQMTLTDLQQLIRTLTNSKRKKKSKTKSSCKETRTNPDTTPLTLKVEQSLL